MTSTDAGDTRGSPPNEFDHFVRAQAPVYDQVLRELAAGQKRSHWIWFIFPQLKGLGYSSTSKLYGIESLAQAHQYLEHDVLGPRLHECTQLVLDTHDRTAEDIFGYPDWMKFRSSMTLFSLCSPPGSVFAQAIDKYFAGQPDEKTLRLLNM
jgi:uncharacterized protein (DUF1810 family)